MTVSLLARVRWANVLRAAAALAVIPLLIVALRGGSATPDVPSGAVVVPPQPVSEPAAPPKATPPAAPPRATKAKAKAKAKRKHHNRVGQSRPLVDRPRPAPALTSAAPPAPPPAAEFRP